ncbi:MAG: DUF3467 domain-containing protein [Elusimicrobiota bacterium]
MSEQPRPAEIKIEIDEETARGVYSNLAFISHSETEFVLDFTFLQPHSAKTKVQTRIITSPAHAKRFVAALQENIVKYEARFGPVAAEAPPNALNQPSDYYQ